MCLGTQQLPAKRWVCYRLQVRERDREREIERERGNMFVKGA
jgi:hypothetical protein